MQAAKTSQKLYIRTLHNHIMKKGKQQKKKSNLRFFNSFKTNHYPGQTLLVVEGKIAFKDKSAAKVIRQYSKMAHLGNRDVSIITVPKNRSVMVV
jgi:hypothetical protein